MKFSSPLTTPLLALLFPGVVSNPTSMPTQLCLVSFSAASRPVVGVAGVCYLTRVQPYLLWNVLRESTKPNSSTFLKTPRTAIPLHPQCISDTRGTGDHKEDGVRYISQCNLAIKDIRIDRINKRMNGYFGVIWTGKKSNKTKQNQQVPKRGNKNRKYQQHTNLILQVWG